MRLFTQKGTSPIRHLAPASDSNRSRSSNVVVGVSLARQPHGQDSGPHHPLAEISLTGTRSSCTLTTPVQLQAQAADGVEAPVLELFPVSASEVSSSTNTPESEVAHLVESTTEIQCGAIDLSCRDLICVLPQIALFATNVTSLNLSRNALTCLPEEIGYLVCLQRIDISQNRIESLPATLAYCQDLLMINATQNRLKELPSSMRHCRLLREVVLADNMLESVPSCLCNLGSLKCLNLSNNRIRALPACMFMPGGIAATNKPPTLDLNLHGCPIGQGLADHVPSPPLVLSARFKYGVTMVDSSQLGTSSDCRVSSGSQRRHILTLTDTIICNMANANASYPYNLPDHLRERLDGLVICDHCHTLYPADRGVKRWRLIHRQDSVWPVEYNFCQAHWNDERQRIASLFAPRKLESAQSYSASRHAALGQTKLKILETSQSLRRTLASPMSLLASRLSFSTLANRPIAPESRQKSSLLKRFSSEYKHKYFEPAVSTTEVGRNTGRRSSSIGLRLPSFVASTPSSDAPELEPDTVWQYYEGYIPRLPALSHC